jgi:hypothetical protein
MGESTLAILTIPIPLMPDITIETSLEDYASAKDTVLDAIRHH